MPSRDKKDLHPTLVDAYNRTAERYSKMYPTLPQPFLTCTYRSNEEQNALFQQGVADPKKKVTNARGGQSPHNYLPSLAFDIAFIGLEKNLDWSNANFKNFATIFNSDADKDKLEWGGGWKSLPDAPHFQLKNWQNYLTATQKV